MHWYQYTKTQLQSELKTDAEVGLSQTESKERLERFGLNILPEKPPEVWLGIFFRQFKSPLIYVLLVCAAIIFYLREATDSAVILVVLLFNAVIGAAQEGRSQQTLKSLKKLSFAEANLLRGGEEVAVPEAEAVAGDILLLQEGQKIIADARVIFSSNLQVDEAALTGESGAVLKYDEVLSDPALPAASQHNMVFKGTSVLSGSGKAIIVGTGINTELGKISRALFAPQTEIPLQRNIKRLSKAIIYFIIFFSLALFLYGVGLGRNAKEMFAIVVSLAVSVIPEGLPLVLTLILVTGVWRMSKRNVLVKKLQAVEALGQASVLAVDKTGTLTRNEMVVKKLFLLDRVFFVSGSGYEPKGQVLWKDSFAGSMPDIVLAGKVAALVSKAKILYSKTEGVYKVAGDPTEAAMAVLAEKLGLNKENLEGEYKELAEITFDHKEKYHAIFYEHGQEIFCAVAGAPEMLLKKAAHFLQEGQKRALGQGERKIFEEAVEDFTSQGLRVVAFGFKILGKIHPLDSIDGLTFAGLFGIEDSVRPEAIKAIAKVRAAGLKIIMITGDHKNTAKAIALEAGVFVHGDIILTDVELDQLTARQLSEKLASVSVFARVTPEHKMKIIQAYKHLGLIVAMTGDGVNDAPSLVAADLGVAMGKIGTEVAKEAADIVLLDDNLSSIVAAIEEGRVMHQNIKKALQFLFSTGLGELLTIVLALALNLPLPIIAVQILWLNLVTDPLIGAALAMEKENGESHSRNVSKIAKYFIDLPMVFHMLVVGTIMSVGALYIFKLYFPVDELKARTLAVTLLAVFQWYNALNCRFLYKSLFQKRIFSNIYIWLALLANFLLQLFAISNSQMQKILHVTNISLAEWTLVLSLGLIIIFADELRKFFYRLIHKTQ